MRLNTKPNHFLGYTHEGAPAARINPEQQLRRSVMACLLWESEFYEDGQTIADRITQLVAQVHPSKVTDIAREARNIAHLRHVPLLLVSALAKRKGAGVFVEDVIPDVIQRADELAELVAVHAKVNGVAPNAVKKKLSAGMKRGLARAFPNFSEHELAKYDRAGEVRLRDVLFLCHAKPKDESQAAMWKRLVEGKLATPDTWEVGLSTGGDKKETFERLIREGKLGYLALLRNLRNMVNAGCDLDLVKGAITARRGSARVLPFRYVAAARACPQLEPAIDAALCASIAEMTPLKGRTVVMVDVSGSMDAKLSAKSDLSRKDAAAALASVIRADDLRVFSFASKLMEVPARRGMAGIDAIQRSQNGGTELIAAVREVNAKVDYDRIIVITDEQAFADKSRLPHPKGKGYMVNVASAKNGVGYGPWSHIDGFSESVIRYIMESERAAL